MPVPLFKTFRWFALFFIFMVSFSAISLAAENVTITINSDQGDPAEIYEDTLWHVWLTADGGSPKCSCWDWDNDGLISVCVGKKQYGVKNWAKECFNAYPAENLEDDAYYDSSLPWDHTFTFDTSEPIDPSSIQTYAWSAGFGWIGGEWVHDFLWYIIMQLPSAHIIEFNVPSEEFEPDDIISMNITFDNNDSKSRTNTYYVKIVLIDEKDGVTNIPHKEVTLAPGESTTVEFNWEVALNATEGKYVAIAQVWSTEWQEWDENRIADAFEVVYGTCIPLRENGKHSEKIDLLFVPDETYRINLSGGGTNQTQINIFRNDINNLLDGGLLNISPLNQQVNTEKFNFYYTTETGTTDFGDWNYPDKVERQCNYADVKAIIHTDRMRDSARGSLGVMSAKNDIPGLFTHECGHAVFRLYDTYCGWTAYSQSGIYPNIWTSLANCNVDKNNESWSANCEQIQKASTGCSVNYWRLDDLDIMKSDWNNYFDFNDASLRRVNWILQCGYPESCSDPVPSDCAEYEYPKNRCDWNISGVSGASEPLPVISSLSMRYESGNMYLLSSSIEYNYFSELILFDTDWPVKLLAEDGSIITEIGISDPRYISGQTEPIYIDNFDLDLDIPYIPDTDKIEIYNQTELLLSIDISDEIDEFCALNPIEPICLTSQNGTNQTIVHIEADIDIHPETLNLKSKGKWITVLIGFPEGYDVSTIDLESVNIEHFINAETNQKYGFVTDPEIVFNKLMVKFDRSEVQELSAMASPGEITLKVYGEFEQGTFEGEDAIRVIHQIKERPINPGQQKKQEGIEQGSENKGQSKDKENQGKAKGKDKN